VEQYATKFIELPRFAPYLVPIEDLKVRKFERDLQPRIMNRVVGLEIGNLTDLISRALVIEPTLKISAEDFNQKKRNALQGNYYGEQPSHANKRRFNHPPERNHAP
jgi:hypothetical protein